MLNKILFNNNLIFQLQFRQFHLIKYVYKRSICQPDHFLASTRSKYSTSPSGPLGPIGLSKKERSLRKKDNIEADYTLIYKTSLDNYVKITQFITGISTVAGSLSVLFQYLSRQKLVFPAMFDLEFISGSDTDYFIFLAGFLILNAAILSVTTRFPLRIYHNKEQEKYLAFFSHFLPTRTIRTNFEQGDISTVPTKFSILPGNYAYTLRGKKIILLEEAFRTNADLEKMLMKKY